MVEKLPSPTILGSRKKRLDMLVFERGLAESRERAKQLILAGQVLVEGEPRFKPGRLIPVGSTIYVKRPLRYVSRGGLKLEEGLQVFHTDVHEKVAIDVGASTGGFTDCLLQHGAKFVYAVDVGYGELAWRLRIDPRVCPIERTNIRTIDLNLFDRPVAIGVIDVAFISLQKVLPVVSQIVEPRGDIIALVKPQFEAGRKNVGKGGVVRHPHIHVQVLQDIIQFAQEIDWPVMGLTYSPIQGRAGNIEFLLWMNRNLEERSPDWRDDIAHVVQQAHEAFQ